jgi:hypothetical protein
MAKTVLMFAIAALVLLSIGVWLATAGPTGNAVEEVLMVVIVLLLVGFALFKGIQRVRSLERKEPFEDELSKKTMTKSSSLSYYISLYLWLFIMYISDRSTLETHTLIGAGIACMAVIFLASWLWVRMVGLKNE